MNEVFPNENELESAGTSIVYDTATGDVLVTHEVLYEPGCKVDMSDEASQKLAYAEYGKRSTKVLHRAAGWMPKGPCKVDPASDELFEDEEPISARTFRRKGNTEPYP